MRWLLTTFLSFLSPLLDSLPPHVFFTCVLISVVSQSGKCPLSQPSHVHPGNSSFRLFPIRGRAVVNRISLESSGYVRCCHCHCPGLQPSPCFSNFLARTTFVLESWPGCLFWGFTHFFVDFFGIYALFC